MTRLVRAELTKLRTIRLFYGVTAAMAAFGVLTVVANVTSAGQQGNPPLSAHSLPGLVGARPSSPPRPRAGGGGQAGRLHLVGIAVAILTLAVTTAVALAWMNGKDLSVIRRRAGASACCEPRFGRSGSGLACRQPPGPPRCSRPSRRDTLTWRSRDRPGAAASACRVAGVALNRPILWPQDEERATTVQRVSNDTAGHQQTHDGGGS
jgi:hypothetical protein